MAPQPHDSHGNSRPRARSNATTAFGALTNWRRARLSDQNQILTGTPAEPVQTLPLETLIQALTPPAVPSLNHARALAEGLRTQIPPPSPSLLIPIAASLCSTESPASLQAAGFDVLASYCKCGTESFTTSDRLAFLDLIRLGSDIWLPEVWETRLNALEALVSPSGSLMGSSRMILNLVISWIDAAFKGLLSYENLGITLSERQERERAVETSSDFVTGWFEKIEIAASLSDADVVSLFNFFADLFDRALVVPMDLISTLSLPATPVQSPSSSSVFRHQHRKHPSSTSGLISPTSSISSVSRPLIKHPAHLAACIFVRHLEAQYSTLSPSHLPSILPPLLRIQGVFLPPLPVLSVRSSVTDNPAAHTLQALESRLVKAITSLLNGMYSTRCLIILKQQLLCLPPPDISSQNPTVDLAMDISKRSKTATGGLRVLRIQVRRVLEDRLAMLYISRGASSTATHAGTPGLMAIDQYLIERAERAWRKDGSDAWQLGNLRFSLTRCVRAWIDWMPSVEGGDDVNSLSSWQCVKEAKALKDARESVLDEVACILKDVVEEMNDAAEEDAEDYNEQASSVGEVLSELVSYIPTLRSDTVTFLPVSRPVDAPTPFLRSLAGLLARDQAVSTTDPCISLILLPIASFLSDVDSFRIPSYLSDQQMLCPLCPDWLDIWEKLFNAPALLSLSLKPRTRRKIMLALDKVHEEIKDMPNYRRPLVELVFKMWMAMVQEGNDGDDGMLIWRILGEEVVLRAFEDDKDQSFAFLPEQTPSPNLTIQKIIDVMLARAGVPDKQPDESLVQSPETTPMSPNTPVAGVTSNIVSNNSSPAPSRTHPESPNQKESGMQMPQLMSLLSFGTSTGPRPSLHSPALPPEESLVEVIAASSTSQSVDPPAPPSSQVAAAVAFIDIFTQLVCSGRQAADRHVKLALVIFDDLLTLLRNAGSSRVRLTILQFLMRLRADRDHRVYIKPGTDHDPNVIRLSSFIDRNKGSGKVDDMIRPEEPGSGSADESRLARSRHPFADRDGRRTSRGRGSRSSTTASRSRSRAPVRNPSIKASTPLKAKGTIWSIPENILFNTNGVTETSETMVTYDPSGPDTRPVLLVSFYLDALVTILKAEKDWEVLSYLLVHLPTQLANKHFWCGPMARESMVELTTALCKGTAEGTLGKDAASSEAWPPGVKARDAQGLAYHSLGVLISYHNLYDAKKRIALVEVFQGGLSGSPSTVICCLQALSLSAFELPQAMVRFLPRILEKLSQIMTNPAMAVHIINFLSNVASIPFLYANFTENDYKMVFGVALQYLQHHNRPETFTEISFTLSQHVRVMSYHLIYVWFLAVKLPDRPRHIKFIGRQLLLANEGREDVDEPTEVCFDWLARYTYANADPKPAPSLLGDIVSMPCVQQPEEELAVQEKSWTIGHSIVTIRTLAKPGWFEVISRRASGTTKFLCKNENVPLVDLGDVEPDMVTIPASLMMDRDPNAMRPIDSSSHKTHADEVLELFHVAESADGKESEEPKPDPITGYVWSGSAPSQRRKRVDMDPSFFPLQLSAYPDVHSPTTRGQIVRDTEGLARHLRTLDFIPVIDTHKVGILYVGPNQTSEIDILRNEHGSPAYTRFLKGLGRLIKIRGQLDVYTGGLDPDVDGEYAYAWWDDTGQILYHTATMMPTREDDMQCNNKKRHIGNDFVRIVWNDSGLPYKFDTLTTQFQFVNVVVEPHSYGAIAAYSDNLHENEYFKVTLQKAEGMAEFSPIGDFKIVSAQSLPPLLRQISLQADWYACVFQYTDRDTSQHEFITNWRARLQAIKRFATTVPVANASLVDDTQAGVMGQETIRDFTTAY